MYKSLNSPSHITLVIWVRLGLQGIPILLGFWEWGCPKRGDTHITVTLFHNSPAGEVYNSETSYSVLKRDCKDSREGIFSRQC